MVEGENALGKQVIARTAGGMEQGRGKAVAYCEAPTYVIEQADGVRFSWCAHLCEIQEIYTYETSGIWDQSGYVIYAPDGKRIEPWDLVELLNVRLHEMKAGANNGK